MTIKAAYLFIFLNSTVLSLIPHLYKLLTCSGNGLSIQIMGSDKKIKIRLKSSFAVGPTEEFLANFQDGHEVIMEFDKGSTVLDLLNRLSSIGAAHEWDDMLLHVFVNQVLKGMDYVLQDNDEINLHLPISGG